VPYIPIAKARGFTARLVIYDHKKTSAEDILDLVDSVVSSYSLIAYKRHRKQNNAPWTVRERRLQEEPISNQI